MSDYTASATFVNPYSSSEHAWAHTLMVGVSDDASKQWVVFTAVGTPDLDILVAIPGLPRRVGRPRRQQLYGHQPAGRRIEVFINGERVYSLPIDPATYTGDVSVGTGTLIGSEQAGAVTRVEDFWVVVPY